MVNGTNTDRVRRENSERLKERSQSGTVRTASAAHTPKKAVRPPSGAGRSASSSAAARKRRLSKKKKRQRRILLFAVLFLLFAIAVLVGSILLATRAAKSGSCSGTAVPASTPEPEGTPIPVTDATVIGSDVTVNGMRLVGKTVAEARTLVEAELEDAISRVDIRVAYGEYSMDLTGEKLGMYYDLGDTLETAARAETRTELNVPLRYNENLLKESLAELNEQIPNHAVNATCEISYRQNKVDDVIYNQPYFKYTAGTNGMAVDFDDMLRQVEEVLNSGTYIAEITPNVTVSEPTITEADWRNRTTLLGSFTTNYRFRGTSSMDEESKLNCESRDINISKAVGIMNVIQLAPGKQFSYNKKTGSRTEKNGWALANAIYKSSHRPEAGGGVCQLSTTMYNALLLANVRIDSRRAHSMPVDYVDKGWDATVDDGHIDFKFTNNTDDTLYVFCYLTKNKSSARRKDIHVEVYGVNPGDGVKYKQRSELVETIPFSEEIIKDKTMYVSDKQIVEREGTEGYTIYTYIDKYVNGTFVKTVYSETTTYEPISRQIRVGTKADPVSEPVVDNPENE